MGFLDNSGDIILDAVLTDTGRMRLARGDGSFRIAKYAFGDDEINYTLYRNANHSNGAHASGSAYADLEIMQTPILEAFTNNVASLKSKLLSIPRNNLLYLPVLKLNYGPGAGDINAKPFSHTEKDDRTSNGYFLIACTQTTWSDLNAGSGGDTNIINGVNYNGRFIRLDQGLDTSDIPQSFEIDSDLYETQYIIELDHRLGRIASSGAGQSARVSFIDDDNIASYYFTTSDTDYVKNNSERGDPSNASNLYGTNDDQVVLGPRGSILQFTILPSLTLRTNDYLFDQLGSTATLNGVANVKYVDAHVRITGATTGYRYDVPIRFAKK